MTTAMEAKFYMKINSYCNFVDFSIVPFCSQFLLFTKYTTTGLGRAPLTERFTVVSQLLVKPYIWKFHLAMWKTRSKCMQLSISTASAAQY